MIIELLFQKIWSHFPAEDISPFKLRPFEVENVENKILEQYQYSRFLKGVAFYSLNNYSRNDFIRYLKSSKEYCRIEDAFHQTLFIGTRLEEFSNQIKQDSWKKNQMSIAIGIASQILNSRNTEYKLLQSPFINFFQRKLRVDDAELSSIILIN
mgnify:CR=1 FL=1